jgi:glycosyltransferase involved in cell wall biosynthesis
LPPARNGIADYSFILLNELRRHAPTIALCDNPAALAPEGVEVRDAAQAWRWLQPSTPLLHQIGNNGGHVFVLRSLRQFPGVVTLHDLNLLYLYELASPRLEDILAGMERSSPKLAPVFASDWKNDGIKTGANYILFDMVEEILTLSKAMIVHSQFAVNKLRLNYGDDLCRKISVIPHFAPPMARRTAAEARRKLGLDQDATIVMTSGFATRTKRFDWLLAALDDLLDRGHRFVWIHAGEERPDEYPLSKELSARPRLQAVTRITGYISEEDLDAYIQASDIVVNLRFPSVGESSGTLARAFSAGRCCIVSDTAAYAELPRDAVVHIPVLDTAGALLRALDGLLSEPAIREHFGRNAAAFAEGPLSMASVGKAYKDVMDEAYESPILPLVRGRWPAMARESSQPAQSRTIRLRGHSRLAPSDVARALQGQRGPVRLELEFATIDELTQVSLDRPGFLASVLPASAEIRRVRIGSRTGAGAVSTVAVDTMLH